MANPLITRQRQRTNTTVSGKPTLSAVPNNTTTQGSGIVMMSGAPEGTYTYTPQSDYQTISYSDKMKQQAKKYSQSKNVGEQAAGNLYLKADEAASQYESFISPVTKTFDVETPVNTGRPVQDFLANAGRGFITTIAKAPSDLTRLTGASGLSLAMLGNANNAQKAEVLSTGLPNYVGAQVDSFQSNPGAFVGSVGAGVVGGKVIGKVAGAGKKATTGKTKVTAAKTGKTTKTKKTTGEYKYKGKGKKNVVKTVVTQERLGVKQKNSGFKRKNSEAAVFDKFLRERRARDIAADIELREGGILTKETKDYMRQARMEGRVTAVRSIRKNDIIGVTKGGGVGRTKYLYSQKRPTQTALVTAKDARTPRNNTRKERRRVQQIVDVQRKSGALFQDMKLRVEPMRLSVEKGLITAADARKPRNRTNKERQRVRKVTEAQQKSGASKMSAARRLDLQRQGRRGKVQTGAKKQTTKTRRPRAYETKVTRRASIEEVPGLYKLERVPRYAAGASTPRSIQVGGQLRLTLDGDAFIEPTYKLKLEPVSTAKQQRVQKAVSKAKTAEKKKPAARNPAKVRAKARAESPRKKRAKVEFEKVDTDQFVKGASSKKSTKTPAKRPARPTSAQVKNSGPTGRKTADGKTILRDKDGTEYVEVDAGRGMKYKVRVKPQEGDAQKASKATSAKRKTQTMPKKQAVKTSQRKQAGKSAGTKNPPEQKSQTVSKQKSVRAAAAGEMSVSGASKTMTVLKQKVNQTTGTGETGTTGQTGSTVVDSTTAGKTDTAEVTLQRVSSRAKSASKSETETRGVTRAKNKARPVPTVKPVKKPKPVKKLDDEKKKQKRKMKEMEKEAFRFETVNTFGWIKDTKPAAKPRKIR